MKISKNHNVKGVTFQTYSNKHYSKIISTLIAIGFGKNFEFSVLDFISKKLVIKFINPTALIQFKILKSTTFVSTSTSNYSSQLYFITSYHISSNE